MSACVLSSPPPIRFCMAMRLYRGGNDITYFLINLFVLQVAGRVFVRAVLWLLRLFGMPQMWAWWHTFPHREQWLSTVLLIVAVVWSIGRVIRKGRRTDCLRKEG